MNRYIKNGKIYSSSNLYRLHYNNTYILNPSESQILAAGYEIYVPPIEERLATLKKDLTSNIKKYDTSSDVNVFYINDDALWLDKNTRSSLMSTLNIQKSAGETTTKLWYNSKSYELTVDNAISLLSSLELYAKACYDNTQTHLSNVLNSTDEDYLKNYDYKSGYPEKLHVRI